jgi:APA family basic amino acid/polyamine antiporter
MAIYTMSAPRIYFAMARDGVFFKELAKLHPRYQTPANAMLLQSVWAILLLLFWGKFDHLITYVTFIDIAFMALAGVGIFIFRKQYPEANRPYQAWGYPVIPAIYVLITTAFLANTLLERPEQAWAGLLVLGVGVGVYQFIREE